MYSAMKPGPAISVLLPTRGESAHFAGALASLNAQTLRPAEVLVVHTGMSGPRHELIALAPTLPIRVIAAPGANLATALNIGLREARHPLVARMDDDDESPPNRFAAQAAFHADHPSVIAVGTAFERIDALGDPIETCNPPCDPREVRWRMLLDNCVAHGSVMLRRDAVLAAGGYDESCERAQDYELWLRLALRGPVIANLPQVLYRYRCDPSAKDASGWKSSPEQSRTAAGALMRAWAALPSICPDPALESCVAAAFRGEQSAGAGIEQLLTREGPTRDRLQALTWLRTVRGHTPAAALEAGRVALLREAGAALRACSATRVWLWGAGRHTEWVLRHLDDLGLPVAGIVDDDAHGTNAHGHPVRHPDELDAACHVLLSSDVHEQAMWASSAAARARGVRVMRLYADNAHRRGMIGVAA